MGATALSHFRLSTTALAAINRIAEGQSRPDASPGNRTAAISEAVIQYDALLEAAVDDNAKAFSKAEWCYLADVLNGYFWPEPGDMTAHASPSFLAAEIEDGHRLNRLGEKWFARESKTINRSKIDKQVAEFVERIHSLDQLHVLALSYIIRRFWLHPAYGLDEGGWWTWSYGRADVPEVVG